MPVSPPLATATPCVLIQVKVGGSDLLLDVDHAEQLRDALIASIDAIKATAPEQHPEDPQTPESL